MKKFITFFTGLFCLSFLLLACDDSTDSTNSTNLFTTPQNVIENLDTELSFSSSRSVLTTDAGDSVTINDNPADFYNDSEYTYKILSGDVSTTQCILKMTKNEISEAIGNLNFNTLFSQEITGTYTIDTSEGMTIKLQHFQMNHESDSNTAYIYSSVKVYYGSIYTGTYDSVLKCTENSIGTLDTTLYMTNKNSQSPQELYDLYVKFNCESSKKTRKELDFKLDTSGNVKETKWYDYTIDANGIFGYNYKNKPNEEIKKKSIKLGTNKYSAVYQDYDEPGTAKDFIKIQYFTSEGLFNKMDKFKLWRRNH